MVLSNLQKNKYFQCMKLKNEMFNHSRITRVHIRSLAVNPGSLVRFLLCDCSCVRVFLTIY